MFDRLVCMNGGNPQEDLIARKDPDKVVALEHDPAWTQLILNRLEGPIAASSVMALAEATNWMRPGDPIFSRLNT